MFGTADVLIFMPGAAAPFFGFMWKAIIVLTLLSMVGLVLLHIIWFLFFQ